MSEDTALHCVENEQVDDDNDEETSLTHPQSPNAFRRIPHTRTADGYSCRQCIRALVLIAAVTLTLTLILHVRQSKQQESRDGHHLSSFVTVVTAYFPAGTSSFSKAKHSAEEYRVWLNNFFTNSFHQCGLYVFTSVSFYPHLALYRYSNIFRNLTLADLTPETINHPERIKKPYEPGASTQNLVSFTYWNVDFDSPLLVPPITSLNLSEQYELDPEKFHSPFLYAIWNAKPWFVNTAALHNVFASEYFIWMDAGSFRPYEWKFPNWPNTTKWIDTFAVSDSAGRTRVSDSILYGLLSSWPGSLEQTQTVYCNMTDRSLLPQNMTSSTRPVWVRSETGHEFVQGTFWAGSIRAVAWYATTYYQTIQAMADRKWLIGTEQSTMSGLVLTYPERFITLHAYLAWHLLNSWFFLPVFFATDQDFKQQFKISLNDPVRDPSYMITRAVQICEKVQL